MEFLPEIRNSGIAILRTPWRGKLTHIYEADANFYYNGGRSFLSRNYNEFYRLASNDIGAV